MEEQAGTLGPSRSDRLDLRLRASAKSAFAARRALDHLDVPEPLMSDAKLLVSELVTNSVLHSGLGPGEEIHVVVTWTGSRLRVAVRDRKDGPARPLLAGSIRPSPGAQSGWGLFLVDRIASRWGTTLRGGPGYWFELERPAESPST